MENNIFSKKPVNWTVCTQADCPLHERCLRYQAFEYINSRHTQQRCVLPSARNDRGCRYHVPFAKVPVAWGMHEMLDGIQKDDAQQMRASLEKYFKSHSTYYRYYNEYDMVRKQN